MFGILNDEIGSLPTPNFPLKNLERAGLPLKKAVQFSTRLLEGESIIPKNVLYVEQNSSTRFADKIYINHISGFV